ncbi:MAG: chemotaxis protein CheA [Clostridiaceae bacterium]
MDETQKYRELFFEETDDYLQSLNENLLLLEKDAESVGTIDEIFRSAHTLKGMAATMGYTTMTELTHHMENILELFRSKTHKITKDAVSVIFKCLDKLSEIVEDLREENYPEYDISGLIEELDRFSSHEVKPISLIAGDDLKLTFSEISEMDASVLGAAIEKGYGAFSIIVNINENCMLKGARAYLVISRLEENGEILQTSPRTEDLEEGNYNTGFTLLYITKLRKEEVIGIIENVSEVETVLVEELNKEMLLKPVLRPREVKSANHGKLIEMNKMLNENQMLETAQVHDKASSHAPSAVQSIRVDLNRLDNLMNLVSELVIYRTRLEELSSKHQVKELNEPLGHVARITSELQELVLKIRMQPVSVVFNRFPRLIRDLSEELGKDIALLIEGEETELDRTVVSELSEPLVHLMRNAADHGIESAEERVARGKSPQGTIHLTASQEGNHVIINVSDDGKGIDPQKIKESAMSKGISTEGLSPNELIQLIFLQGFSTNTEVTNISGRGVGMDVVRSKITSLGGSLEVLSEIDHGTNFVIKLPLTLSIIQALMVHIGNEVYAIPLGIIEKVLKLTPGDIKASHFEEVYVYREKVIPVIRLSEKLDIVSKAQDQHLILVAVGGKRYGLVVDDLIGQQEIVIKKLSGTLSKMKEYLGASILGNGEITLILDVGNLCSGAAGKSE